jgi:hypothetical protein
MSGSDSKILNAYWSGLDGNTCPVRVVLLGTCQDKCFICKEVSKESNSEAIVLELLIPGLQGKFSRL